MSALSLSPLTEAGSLNEDVTECGDDECNHDRFGYCAYLLGRFTTYPEFLAHAYETSCSLAKEGCWRLSITYDVWLKDWNRKLEGNPEEFHKEREDQWSNWKLDKTETWRQLASSPSLLHRLGLTCAHHYKVNCLGDTDTSLVEVLERLSIVPSKEQLLSFLTDYRREIPYYPDPKLYATKVSENSPVVFTCLSYLYGLLELISRVTGRTYYLFQCQDSLDESTDLIPCWQTAQSGKGYLLQGVNHKLSPRFVYLQKKTAYAIEPLTSLGLDNLLDRFSEFAPLVAPERVMIARLEYQFYYLSRISQVKDLPVFESLVSELGGQENYVATCNRLLQKTARDYLNRTELEILGLKSILKGEDIDDHPFVLIEYRTRQATREANELLFSQCGSDVEISKKQYPGQLYPIPVPPCDDVGASQEEKNKKRREKIRSLRELVGTIQAQFYELDTRLKELEAEESSASVEEEGNSTLGKRARSII